MADAEAATVGKRVGDFYESHPYPPPRDDLETYRRTWNDRRRRADRHLFFPGEPYRDNHSILVAGCGTMQAAHYAVRWPRARVVGIDVSESSIAFERELKKKHSLENLELHRLEVERAAELDEQFEHVVCTGVLHHLADPERGLRALRSVLTANGALHLMLYAPYGRAGIYMLQEYCRRLGLGWSDSEVDELAATLRALPRSHPLAPLLQHSPDFTSKAGIADALLHPNDRAYSVDQFMELIEVIGLTFGRWIRQAPYLPQCGAVASSPHAARIAALPAQAQYAALELFRGTMLRHNAILYPSTQTARTNALDFSGDAALDYVPIRLPRTIAVKERLPEGAAAVLINRDHIDNDLYLPIDAQRLALFESVDGERTIGSIAGGAGRAKVVRLFQQLWAWDQIVVDASAASR